MTEGQGGGPHLSPGCILDTLFAIGPPAAAHHGKSTVLNSPSPAHSARVAPSNLAATQGSQPFNLEEIPGFLTPSECAAVIAIAQVSIRESAGPFYTLMSPFACTQDSGME